MYRYEWCEDDACEATNTRLTDTGRVHEEFTMIAPSGERMAWMRGPREGLGYEADLYLSTLELDEIRRATFYNDCDEWPARCLEHGGQLGALTWSPDGRALYYGMWEHGRVVPFVDVRIHVLELAGPCGAE